MSRTDEEMQEMKEMAQEEYFNDAMIERKWMLESFAKAEKHRNFVEMFCIINQFEKETQDQEDLYARYEALKEKEAEQE